MSYGLGVDVGTTFTSAAVSRGGSAVAVQLGQRSFAIPTVVAVGDDGSLIVGDAAVVRARTRPESAAKQFKRRMGADPPILLGATPYSPQRLYGEVLRWGVDTVTAEQGAEADAIVVTHPANWHDYRLGILHEAVQFAGLEGAVELVSEPIAAATHYGASLGTRDRQLVAVYDLGGGTFDAVVLRATANGGFEIEGEAHGVNQLGGIDFDRALLELTISTIRDRWDAVDRDASTPRMAAFMDSIVTAKEALSTDTAVSIPVDLPEIDTEIRVTRSEFEEAIAPALSDSLQALQRALDSANVTAEELDAVLLVGGSSRIPYVGQLVAAQLGRPVVVDANPKLVTALGAAAIADPTTISPQSSDPPPEQTIVVPERHDEPTTPGPALSTRADDPTRGAGQPGETEEPPAQARHDNQRRQIIRRGASVAVAVLAATAAVLVFALRGNDADETPTPAVIATVNVGGNPLNALEANGFIWVPDFHGETVSVIDPDSFDIVATIDVGDDITADAVALDGWVWVLSAGDGTVSVIDPASFDVAATIDVGSDPRTPVAENSFVWVPNAGDDTVSVIDPDSFDVAATVDVGDEPGTPAVMSGFVWVPNFGDGTVSVIDAAPFGDSFDVVATIDVGSGPSAPVASKGLVWVPNLGSGTVSVIDPDSFDVVATVDVGDRPGTPAVMSGFVWVPNFGDDTVSVIDPASFDVVATVDVGDQPVTPLAANDLIWVPNLNDETISVINPDGFDVTATLGVGDSPTTPVAANDLIWVPNLNYGEISVIDPPG